MKQTHLVIGDNAPFCGIQPSGFFRKIQPTTVQFDPFLDVVPDGVCKVCAATVDRLVTIHQAAKARVLAAAISGSK